MKYLTKVMHYYILYIVQITNTTMTKNDRAILPYVVAAILIGAAAHAALFGW